MTANEEEQKMKRNYRRSHKKIGRATIFMATLILVWCFGIFMSSPPVFAELIIIDHTAVQEFYNIPDEYIEAAKNLALHFGTTDGGLEVIAGLVFLELDDPKYNIHLRIDGIDEEYPGEDPALHISVETDTYHEDYWSTDEGRAVTRAFAYPGDYNYSTWVWDDEDSTDYAGGFIQDYLDTLDGFEWDYPDMRFIYMTRYVIDGGGIVDNDNSMIRSYCGDNDKVLFDIEDIMAHNPYDPYWEDYEICIMKAQAFWAMMARLAGWDGGAVSGRMLGDVNGDEMVNIADALLTLDCAVFRIDLQGDALWAANVNGDVNGNGEPNIAINDALLILDRAVGAIDKFPIE